jgi:4-carboxymuconolactone decarboxylase
VDVRPPETHHHEVTPMSKPDETPETPMPRPPAPRVAPAPIHAAAPALGWYSDNILFGEVWERPELSKRDRSIVTVSALITRGHMAQLTGHFNRALTHGLRPTEIVELVTHMAFYAGWPCAMSAVGVMREVFEARGVGSDQVTQSLGTAPLPAGNAEGPVLEELTERVLNGDLWQRTELAPRDRSLATIASLAAQSQLESLRVELVKGRDNGLGEKELCEAVSHLAFYAGWARASSALTVVRALYQGDRHE